MHTTQRTHTDGTSRTPQVIIHKPRGAHYRAMIAQAHRLAAYVEELSEGSEWTVEVGQRADGSGDSFVSLALAWDTDKELGLARQTLQRATRLMAEKA